MTGVRHHVAVRPPAALAGRLEPLRARWDPVMAARAPAHATVAYPEEAPDLPLLEERMRVVAAAVDPFRLVLGAVTALDEGAGGVFVALDDPDGGWQAARERLLAPPFHPLDVPPHLTLVHPRTSRTGPQAWRALRAARIEGSLRAERLLLTATSPAGWRVLATAPLTR